MNFSPRTLLGLVAGAWPYVLGAGAHFAAACVFCEQHCKGQRRPVAERWERCVGIALGDAGIVVSFNGFKFGYPRDYHRGNQSHYYMGAKYFREMGYGGLYKYSVIAEDELGTVSNDDEEQYKADVRFFRSASDKGYWEDMQKDHGFNPPPVWTLPGRGFGELHGAITGYLQLLAGLDLVHLAGRFMALFPGLRGLVVAGAALLRSETLAPHRGQIAFAWVTRRRKSMWSALCLGQIFLLLLAQLTWYRSSLMIPAAPPARVNEGIEAPFFGLAALSRLITLTYDDDDEYTVLTLSSLVFCSSSIGAFAPKARPRAAPAARSGDTIAVTGAARKRAIAEGD